MGCHILRGVINGDEAVEFFYCSSTDSIVTVPQMRSGEASPFRAWLGCDPRTVRDLEDRYDSWRTAGRPGYDPLPHGDYFDVVNVDGNVEIHENGAGSCWGMSPAEAEALAAAILHAADQANAERERFL